MRRGIICLHITRNDSQNGIVPCVSMKEKMMGDVRATVILLRRLYVAKQAISPPNIPVITAAAVAVGANIQINVPSAIIESRGNKK